VDWDARPLRLDKFAVEDPINGFAAFSGANDPKPGIRIENGTVTMMDSVAAADFDMIDLFVARHHLDVEIAEEAMALPSLDVARMLVDMNVPRAELVRLAHGMTPAKLAEVVAHLNAMELSFAYSKMRARRTPGNQGHVTNAKDDPLQLAAGDAVHGPARHVGDAGHRHRPGDRLAVLGVQPGEASPVGVAAERDDVVHTEAVAARPRLRQHRHTAGELSGAQVIGGLAGPQTHGAGLDAVQPCERAQQRGLARSVGADEGEDTARSERDVGVMHDRRAVVGEREVRAPQGGLRLYGGGHQLR